MRVLPLAILVACQQDTGFSSGTDDQVSGENGTMVLTPTYLLFDDLSPSYAKSATFNVASTGDEQLEIYQARVIANPGGVFTFEDKTEVLINPGSSVDWAVALYVTAEGKYEGSIRIDSNDATTPQVVLDMCGVTLGWSEPCGTDDPGDSGADGE